MTAKFSTLEAETRDLSPNERARLAMKLIESLDPGQDEDAEELWLDEAENRLREYESGKTVARSARDVIAEIERKIK